MKHPSRRLLRLLTRAALLRAAGACWEAVAVRVGRRPQTCRRWPITYPRHWQGLYEAAERRVLAVAVAEAAVVLRAHRQRGPEETPRRPRSAPPPSPAFRRRSAAGRRAGQGV